MVRPKTLITLALLLCIAAVIGAWSGANNHESTGRYAAKTVEIAEVDFPRVQPNTQPAKLRIILRNTSRRPLSNLTATVEDGSLEGGAPFAYSSHSIEFGFSSRSRPAWVLNRAPLQSKARLHNTWMLGAIGPLKTKTYVWHVTALRPGRHTIRYWVGHGLRMHGVSSREGSMAVTIERVHKFSQT